MRSPTIVTILLGLITAFTLLTVFIDDPVAKVSFVLLGVISFIFLSIFTCKLTIFTEPPHVSLPVQEITVPPRILLTAYPTPSKVKYFSWEKNYLPRKPARILPI